MAKGFSKRPKLGKIDHIFILLFILGALYVSSVVLRLSLNLPIYALIALLGGIFLLAAGSKFNGKI
jgi:ABC-type multidrug transport system permease subunit